jgi:transposase
METIGIPQGLPPQFEITFVGLYNEVQALREEVNSLRRKLFGSKSERYAVEATIEPLGGIFNEAEQLVESPSAEEKDEAQKNNEETTITVGTHTRKVGSKKPLPADLPREIVIHDIPEHERICPNDGTPLVPAGVEVTEKLKVTPATFSVVEHRRIKYACSNCEQHVARAAAPASVIPGGMVEPSVLALVTVQKFLFALPLYRQELIFRQMGIEVNRPGSRT